MERLGILSFALEQYSAVLELKRINDEISEVKIANCLTLVIPNQYIADPELESGTYVAKIDNGLIYLEPHKVKNWRK